MEGRLSCNILSIRLCGIPPSRLYNGLANLVWPYRAQLQLSYARLPGLRSAGIFVLFVIEAKYIRNTANEFHTVALWIPFRARSSALYE
jgi:hypothetical protein